MSRFDRQKIKAFLLKLTDILPFGKSFRNSWIAFAVIEKIKRRVFYAVTK